MILADLNESLVATEDKKLSKKYKKFISEARSYLNIFKEFMANNRATEFNVADFIVTLRTHLLMTGLKMADINKYINSIVLNNFNLYLYKARETKENDKYTKKEHTDELSR